MEPLEDMPAAGEGDDQVHADDHPEVEVDEGALREMESEGGAEGGSEPEPDAE